MRTISSQWFFCFVAAFSFLLIVGGRFAYAQGRINDKDMASLMKNLRDDAKSFRGTFDSAIKKSTIRKTSREKDAKNLVARFEKQTDAMLKNFKRTKKGDTDIRMVMDSAAQIDSLLRSVALDGQTASKWAKIQTEIHQVSSGFGIDSQYNPAGGPISATVEGPSCLQGVGAKRANQLVDECMQVSPATHPPCNAQNPCALIADEIRRGCELLKQNAPAFCNEYR